MTVPGATFENTVDNEPGRNREDTKPEGHRDTEKVFCGLRDLRRLRGRSLYKYLFEESVHFSDSSRTRTGSTCIILTPANGDATFVLGT